MSFSETMTDVIKQTVAARAAHIMTLFERNETHTDPGLQRALTTTASEYLKGAAHAIVSTAKAVYHPPAPKTIPAWLDPTKCSLCGLSKLKGNRQ